MDKSNELHPNVLIDQITDLIGELPGKRLPSERSLALRYQVSRAKIRLTLDKLAQEGLVERIRGSGSYAVDENKKAQIMVALLVDAQLKFGNDPFYSTLIERVQIALQNKSIRVIVERIKENERRDHHENGSIIMGMAGRTLLQNRTLDEPPAVGILLGTGRMAQAGASLINVDNFEAGTLAAEKLIKYGNTHFIFAGSTLVPAAAQRLKGAQKTITQAGYEIKILDCRMNYSGGFEVGQHLRLPKDKRTGIIAANDWLAIGLHTSLISQGDMIRGIVDLISFDGLPITKDPALGIENYKIPIDEIAEDSVTELLRLIHNPKAIGRTIIYNLHE